MRAPSMPALARAIAAAVVTTVAATGTPGFAPTKQNFPNQGRAPLHQGWKIGGAGSEHTAALTAFAGRSGDGGSVARFR